MGRNGAGKTTLVDIITKVTKPTSGNLDFSHEVKIGICYQKEILYENLTCLQHLRFYSKIKEIDYEKLHTNEQDHINEIIEMLGIEN